jgi:hypothetical protein
MDSIRLRQRLWIYTSAGTLVTSHTCVTIRKACFQHCWKATSRTRIQHVTKVSFPFQTFSDSGRSGQDLSVSFSFGRIITIPTRCSLHHHGQPDGWDPGARDSGWRQGQYFAMDYRYTRRQPASPVSLAWDSRVVTKNSIETEAEIVGFVFPIQCARMPVALKEFLEKITLLQAHYIFAVATRVGSTHRAFTDIDILLLRKGRSLDASFSLNMPGNDPKFKDYVPATAREIEELESAARIKLDAIHKIILRQEKYREEDTDATLRLPGLLLKVLPLFTALT